MNRKMWIRGAAGLLVGMLLIIGYLAWGRTDEGLSNVIRTVQPTLTRPPATTPAVTDPAKMEERLKQIHDWNIAERRFTTDTTEPLILLQNDKQIIYVQNNQIRYEVIGGTGFQNIPLSFPSARIGYVWRNGKTAYIGLSSGSGSNQKQGDWYEINLTAVTGNPLKRLGELQLVPEEVQDVTFSNKPEGALFLEKTANSYQEYWINAQGKGQFYINDYSSRKDSSTASREGVKDFGHAVFSTVYEFDNLFVMEDERGLLVYENNPTNPSIFRLTGFKFGQAQAITVDEPLRSQPPYSGSTAILLSVTNSEDESRKGILLPAYSPEPFTLSPELMEEGWTLVDSLSFFRIQDGQIQTISYPMDQGGRSPVANKAVFSLAGISKWTRTGTVMQGEKDGINQYLSLNDVMNTRSDPKGTALWMSALPPGQMIPEENQSTADKDTVVDFPKLPVMEEDAAGNDSIPESLRDALKQRDYMGSGDVAFSRVIRKTSDNWYVLTNDKLERWDGVQGLKEIGQLPVKPHCSTSNYVVCATAADFVREDGFWYVADTYNNRIIKLNDAFEIVEQSKLPMPTQLTFIDQGNVLRVEGLQGAAVYTRQLKQVSLKPSVPTAIGKLSKEEIAVSPESLYKDSNGVQWLFLVNRLYVYDPNKQTVLTHFTGAMMNLAGKAKIIPLADKILLVLDDRIQVFDNKGKWTKEISFPRTQPDGIYATTPIGESSYVLDREQEMLIMIQGFRLLQINLNIGTVTPLFWQINANLGKVLMDRGNLYLTLKSANGYETSDAHNELIICNIKTGSLTRFKIAEGFTTHRITKDHELILMPQSESGSNNSAAWMMYKLNEQGIPE